MATEESNKSGTTFKFLEPKDETLNRPLQPHWTTSMQAYYNSGSTATPLLNPHAAGPYFGHYVWPNQASSTALQYDFLHDPRRLSNNPAVPGVILNQQQQQPSILPIAGDAASIFSEKRQRVFGGNNQDSIKKCDGNLQAKSTITKEPRENENGCSTPNHDKNGVSVSGASGSKESSDEGHDNKHDFPSTKKQLGNADSAEQNRNSRIGLNASGSTAQIAKLEEDEIRKERKRQSNRESAKRSRLRKQKECEELHRNMDILKDENSSLTQRLIRLSEECLELSNENDYIQKECEELHRNENSSLTQRLVRLSEECLELSNENDYIQEELVKMYGPESIADLLPMKPA